MADTEKELLCPACGKTMKKVYITDSNINVDICTNGCGGIFFDNRELEKVDEAHENADEILQEIAHKTFKEVDTAKQRICPVCGTTMMKMGAANGEAEIDVCATCGAKFLDAGELQAIRGTCAEPIDAKMCNMLEQVYQQNVDDITPAFADKIPTLPGFEKRKELFMQIVSKYIEKRN